MYRPYRWLRNRLLIKQSGDETMAQTREAVATQRANETYARAVSGTSIKNDLTVIHEFAAMGINATPRVDVFTYNVWKHK